MSAADFTAPLRIARKVLDDPNMPELNTRIVTLARALVDMNARMEDLDAEREALRTSLAQEIREGLRVRGFWAPKRPSDLITAIFKAIDGARDERLQQEIEEDAS